MLVLFYLPLRASSEGFALSKELLGLTILLIALGGFFLVVGAMVWLTEPALRGRWSMSCVPVFPW